MYEEQNAQFKAERETRLKDRIPVIMAGKKRKRKRNIIEEAEVEKSKEQILSELIREIGDLPQSSVKHLIESGAGHARGRVTPFNPDSCLRIRVFRDLWRRGFYLTEGAKFGGDFLAYNGDPVAFHAQFVVICSNKDRTDYSETELVRISRLGTTVKKTVLLASLNHDSSSIKYFCVNGINR